MKRSSFRRRSLLCVTAAALIVAALTASIQAQTAVSTYAAYTGTDTKSIPSPPALGTANSVIDDPTFASRILRVTDSNTTIDHESFISTDAGNHRAWNANSTAIKLTGPHGDSYWLAFDPNAFTVGDGSAHPRLNPLPAGFGATWEWIDFAAIPRRKRRSDSRGTVQHLHSETLAHR